jgi:hypothetical protein
LRDVVVTDPLAEIAEEAAEDRVRLRRTGDGRNHWLPPLLVFGSPCIAAVLTGSVLLLSSRIGATGALADTILAVVVFGNAAIATAASAYGSMLGKGSTGRKLPVALANAIGAPLLYGIVLGFLAMFAMAWR